MSHLLFTYLRRWDITFLPSESERGEVKGFPDNRQGKRELRGGGGEHKEVRVSAESDGVGERSSFGGGVIFIDK